jgi:hypothetical protein
MRKNAELNRVNNDQSTSNRLAEQAIRKLQEQLANTETLPGKGAAAPSDDESGVLNASASPANAQINAKITSLAPSAGHTLIQVPLGTRDGVKVNTALRIYRNSGYVGDAVVQSVFADTSVAQVTIVKPGDTIKVGDLVMTPAAQ